MAHRRQARTISMIRALKAFGPLKRKKKMPRQQQPDLIRLGYYKAIMPFVNDSFVEFAKVRPEIIGLLRGERAAEGRMDASSREIQAKALVERAAARAAAAWEPVQLAEVAKKFGRRTSAFQKEQLDNQVRAAIGVDLNTIEKPITDKLEVFAAQNVELIRTVPERYFDRIRGDVEEAFSSGMEPDTLADILMERDGMAENDAMRIARDQIGKLNAEFNQERQEAMGVTGYVWRGVLDNRERDEHVELEGEHFEWNDPPPDGHPGEPIQCRCYAEPDFEQILSDLEESTTES